MFDIFIIADPFQFHKYRYKGNYDTFPKSVFLKIEILKADLSTIFEDKGCYRFTDFVHGFTSRLLVVSSNGTFIIFLTNSFGQINF